MPSEPGFAIASQTLIFQANTQRALLNGRQTFGLQAFALFDFLAATYTFEQPVLGGRLQIGGAVPVLGYTDMNVSLQTRLFGTFTGGAPDIGIGDSMLTPFSLAWNFGDFNVKVTQYVIVPTGHYDTNNVINTGRKNYVVPFRLKTGAQEEYDRCMGCFAKA